MPRLWYALPLPERERKNLDAGIQKFDLESRVLDRPLLPDELIHPRLANLAGAIGGGIDSVIAAWRDAIQSHLEANGCSVLRRTQDHVKVAAVEADAILPGADARVSLSAPAFHDPPSPH